MPLVLKTLKTFLLAKTRNRYYRIHTSIPPCPLDTHTPVIVVGCAQPPPPPAELPIPPQPHPPAPPPHTGDC